MLKGSILISSNTLYIGSKDNNILPNIGNSKMDNFQNIVNVLSKEVKLSGKFINEIEGLKKSSITELENIIFVHRIFPLYCKWFWIHQLKKRKRI